MAQLEAQMEAARAASICSRQHATASGSVPSESEVEEVESVGETEEEELARLAAFLEVDDDCYVDDGPLLGERSGRPSPFAPAAAANRAHNAGPFAYVRGGGAAPPTPRTGAASTSSASSYQPRTGAASTPSASSYQLRSAGGPRSRAAGPASAPSAAAPKGPSKKEKTNSTTADQRWFVITRGLEVGVFQGW